MIKLLNMRIGLCEKMKMNVKYGSLEYFELAGRGVLGNAWGTKWKAWTKIRYKKYMKITRSIWKNGRKKILDVGCCDGDFLKTLCKQQNDNFFYGADCSQSAIMNIHNKNIKGYHCTANNLPQDFSNQFDLIFCCGTIMYCLPYDVTFDNLYRCLNEKGFLLIEYPYFTDEHKMLKELKLRFNIIETKYEYGKWYQRFFEKEWDESYALVHKNKLLWIKTLILLSNVPLALLFEYITIHFGEGHWGKSGTILLCERKNEN